MDARWVSRVGVFLAFACILEICTNWTYLYPAKYTIFPCHLVLQRFSTAILLYIIQVYRPKTVYTALENYLQVSGKDQTHEKAINPQKDSAATLPPSPEPYPAFVSLCHPPCHLRAAGSVES